MLSHEAITRTREVVSCHLTYGKAVAQRLLPDVLPYRTGTPACFGFAEHNGRTLADNAPEVMFSLVLNSAANTGLTPGQFADTRSSRFPYVVARPDAAR
jgi:hypothetical protein